MEIGLGIHGEPGVRTAEQVPAREIARLLVDTLLAETPAGAGNEVAVLVNGLGGTKYEEMFVLYSGVAPLLARAGLEVYEAQIGEYVTALDMAGCSLTLFWLDDDLKELHDATASSPAYTRIGPDVERAGLSLGAEAASADAATTAATVEAVDDVPGGAAGEAARAALREALAAIRAAEAELGRLDAAAGDGDHGAGMVRGFSAAAEAVAGFGGTARQSFVRGGTAFQNAAGGASGALVGAFLIALGTALPASDDGVDAHAYAAALAEGLATIQRYGGAQVGDKTMIDTLSPFATALDQASGRGAGLAEAWAAALPAARDGMVGTASLTPKVGRASRLAARAVGFQDPGATSMYEMLAAFGRAFGVVS
jgi:dihydroxyacetone kinase